MKGWVLLWSMLCVGCSTRNAELQPKIYASRHVPVVNLGHRPPQPGFHERTVLVDGEPRRIAVWAPERLSATHPLVVYLHGALHPMPTDGVELRRVTMADQMLVAECLIDALRPLEPIVVVPQSRVGQGGQWWRERESEFVIGLTRAVGQSWPVDGRTALMGYSNGGLGTWVLARLYPEYFRAAIPIAFDVGVIGEVAIPVFAIQGEHDELFPFPPVQREIVRQQHAGQPITFLPRPRGSHFRPCDYASEVNVAVTWLQSDAWQTSTGAH